MPGITEDMFFEGAISADYAEVARLTSVMTGILTRSRTARVVREGLELEFSLEGREAVASTGLYHNHGESGNLPSGEAYIAPVEGSARGDALVRVTKQYSSQRQDSRSSSAYVILSKGTVQWFAANYSAQADGGGAVAVLVRRLLGFPLVLLGVSFIVFVSVRAIPGDPALVIAGLDATAEQVQQVRQDLGLDRPVYIQYFVWLSEIARGDFGYSFVTNRPVFPLLMERYWRTLMLAVSSVLIATVVGMTAGIVAAARRNSRIDYLVTVVSMVGVCTPSFWLAIMLILVFAVGLGWFPSGGFGSWRHFVLPSVSLAAFSVGIIARMTRASTLEVLTQDYIRTAWSKGLDERRVLLRHAVKNVLLPVITVIGLQFGYLLAGAAVTETVFFWPGVGRLMVSSIFNRDFPVVQGAVLLIAASFVVVNLIIDLLYTRIDPRIRV